MKKEGVSFKFTKSRTFLMFCFCFISGVGCFSILFFDRKNLFVVYTFFVVLLVLLFFLFRNLKWRYVVIAGLFFILGALRFLLFLPSGNSKELSFYNGQKAVIVGRFIDISATDGLGFSAVLKSESLNGQKIAGRALVKLPPYADFSYGQKVKVKCDLQKPSSKNGFGYERYLARQSIFSLCAFPQVSILSDSDSFFQKIINNFFGFRKNINSKVSELWVEPESALMAGILYGERAGFSREVNDSFSRAGITHIVAISGYNISLLVVIFMGVFLKIGFSRRISLFLVMFFIALFVIFSGASASVFRAGIMGTLVLLASYFGRLSRVGNVLILTAALMLLFNPLVLIYDAGFQLSFLSTLGLVYISPLLLKKFSSIKNDLVAKLVEDFITTISAIIATLPLILFQFGRLSLVAPLANMLVLWIIPHLMWLGFVALFACFLFWPLAWPFAFLAHFGLLYVLVVADFFAGSVWSSIQIDFGILPMLLSYSIIIFWIYVSHKNFKVKSRL